MRADPAARGAPWAGPRTWLLAAIAGWALCVWALGLFGLGGRIEPLPADPSLVKRLPQPVPAVPERLGPLTQYAEVGSRPLFSDDRRPQPFFINPDGEGEQPDTFDFVLTSVLLTPRMNMAILQPAGGGDSVRLKVGDSPDAAPSWTLQSVDARSVVFVGPEGERALELRVFDGIGGEPPTSPTAVTTSSGGQGAQRPAARPMPALVPPPARPANPDLPAPAQAEPQAEPPSQDADRSSPEAQAEAIRQRIEARRAQLLQQQTQPDAPPQTP